MPDNITKHIFLTTANAIKINDAVELHKVSANEIVNKLVHALDVETLNIITKMEYDVKFTVKNESGEIQKMRKTIRKVSISRPQI